MKFLYVDVKKRKLFAVFQNEMGQNFFWNRDTVLEQKKKHEILKSWDMIEQCNDALSDLDIAEIEKQKNKPWWKFW